MNISHTLKLTVLMSILTLANSASGFLIINTTGWKYWNIDGVNPETSERNILIAASNCWGLVPVDKRPALWRNAAPYMLIEPCMFLIIHVNEMYSEPGIRGPFYRNHTRKFFVAPGYGKGQPITDDYGLLIEQAQPTDPVTITLLTPEDLKTESIQKLR